MFIESLLTTAKTWKHVSIKGWMDEDVVYTDIYTAEYYLTFKKKEILSFVTT